MSCRTIQAITDRDAACFPLTFIRKFRMESNIQFEWDDAKAASNFAKHGVEFEFAVRIFLDEARVDFDVSRAADGEVRRKAVGIINGELFAVVYTRRRSIIRLISARRSNVKENRIYASVYPRSE